MPPPAHALKRKLSPRAALLAIACLALLGASQSAFLLLSRPAAPAQTAPPAPSPAPVHAAPTRTPFNVQATDEAAARALTTQMRLVGLRGAADGSPSGAVIALADGTQRAFAIGDEAAPGVTIAAIGADHVVLAFSGGEAVLALARGGLGGRGGAAPRQALTSPAVETAPEDAI